MTYYIHMHNSGYYGRRSSNTLKRAALIAKKWFALGGERRVHVEDKNGIGKLFLGFTPIYQTDE